MAKRPPAEGKGMEFDHIALHVRDLQRSVAFYRDLLGLELIEAEPGQKLCTGTSIAPWRHGGKITFCYLKGADDRCAIELIFEHDRRTPYSLQDMKAEHICFRVKDLDALASRLKQNGVRFLVENARPKYSDTIRRIDYVEDPEGYRVELMEFTGDSPVE